MATITLGRGERAPKGYVQIPGTRLAVPAGSRELLAWQTSGTIPGQEPAATPPPVSAPPAAPPPPAPSAGQMLDPGTPAPSPASSPAPPVATPPFDIRPQTIEWLAQQAAEGDPGGRAGHLEQLKHYINSSDASQRDRAIAADQYFKLGLSPGQEPGPGGGAPPDDTTPPPPGSPLGPHPTELGPPLLNPSPPPLLNPESPGQMFGQITPYPQLGGMFNPRMWQQPQGMAGMLAPAQGAAPVPQGGQPPVQAPVQGGPVPVPQQGMQQQMLPWQMPEMPEALKKRIAMARAFRPGQGMMFGG